MSEDLEITPSITVHQLLQTYPHLEDVLINIAPPFKKLKNPLLRRSVAKVATLKQIASVGGVSLDNLIDTLKQATGQSASHKHYEDATYFTAQPDWFSKEKVMVSIEDATQENKMSVVAILNAAKGLNSGDIIELVTTFLPAPLIDLFLARGFEVWTTCEDTGLIKSYILKNTKVD